MQPLYNICVHVCVCCLLYTSHLYIANKNLIKNKKLVSWLYFSYKVTTLQCLSVIFIHVWRNFRNVSAMQLDRSKSFLFKLIFNALCFKDLVSTTMQGIFIVFYLFMTHRCSRTNFVTVAMKIYIFFVAHRQYRHSSAHKVYVILYASVVYK